MGIGFPVAFENSTACISTLFGAGKPLKICLLILLLKLYIIKNIVIMERLLKADNLFRNEALWPLME